MVWNVPPEAVADLRRSMGTDGNVGDTRQAAYGEAGVQSIVRAEASRKGSRLWRNNVGALEDKTGRFVRYGLANDSTRVNEQIKSADLIGIKPVLIGPQHIGHTVGQFISREIKAPGWKFSGDAREAAQQRWAHVVLSFGGDAGFATGEGTI